MAARIHTYHITEPGDPGMLDFSSTKFALLRQQAEIGNVHLFQKRWPDGTREYMWVMATPSTQRFALACALGVFKQEDADAPINRTAEPSSPEAAEGADTSDAPGPVVLQPEGPGHEERRPRRARPARPKSVPAAGDTPSKAPRAPAKRVRKAKPAKGA